MNKQQAASLAAAVKAVEVNYSRLDRARNFGGETFTVKRVMPTGEDAAYVIFEKNTGKWGLAFFYFMPGYPQAGWRHIFLTDSHLMAFSMGTLYKKMVEDHNYNGETADEAERIPEEALAG